ncbi:uncharacterized protein LOC110819198 isoform X2 [Carica papaya]|uniref:uncharacterized protein LOC110819198 isoform X2 n=1 Tax=Carica papaya TaxID=3649 RepID=UPI000B8D137E|nr:uncharacterized protein LOC110819198 isoform X2 [Carica papaya]
MENKKHLASYSSSSSSASASLDQLFGPRDSSSSSSSSSGIFGSIFPPPSTVLGRKQDFPSQVGNARYRTPEGNKKGESSKRSSVYHNETAEPCYFSSSIYYGGQENYSPRTTADSHHILLT